MVDEPAAFEEFEEFEARYRREYSLFYEFLMAFYDMHVSENSYFWEAKKITKSSHSELESFVDLVAGLNSGERALTRADQAVARLQSDSREFASAVDRMTRADEESMVPLFNASIVRDAMRESTQVQAQALFDDEEEEPVFAHGLVASPDGMHWVRPESSR